MAAAWGCGGVVGEWLQFEPGALAGAGGSGFRLLPAVELEGVEAAEEGAAHTACGAVVEARLGDGDGV